MRHRCGDRSCRGWRPIGPRNPTLKTLATLFRVASCRLTVMDATGMVLAPFSGGDDTRDRAGREFPAHLDVREVRSIVDWWGHACVMTFDPPPPLTFDRSREMRDWRRGLALGPFHVPDPRETDRATEDE